MYKRQGYNNRITLGGLTGVAPVWDANNEPPAAAGIVGQEALNSTTNQRWAKGAGIEVDPLGTGTGIIGRRTLVGGTSGPTTIGAQGAIFNAPNNYWIWEFSATDPTKEFLIQDGYTETANSFILTMRLYTDGRIYIDLDYGNTPPYDVSDFISRLETGDLIVAMRVGATGAWNFAAKTPTDTADAYEWLPTEAAWVSWVAGLDVRGDGQRRPIYRMAQTARDMQIVLLDKTRRVSSNPANNDWYKQSAADALKAFEPGLIGNIIIAASELDGDTEAHQQSAMSGADATNPYDSTQEIGLWPNAGLRKVAGAQTVKHVWLVDGRARCRNDVTSPWLPNDFTAGADGNGLEFVFATTTTRSKHTHHLSLIHI